MNFAPVTLVVTLAVTSAGTVGIGSPAAVAAPASGGAADPQAVVAELLDSVRLSDPLGVLAVLHPAERQLVEGVYRSAASSAEATGGMDVDALLQAYELDIETEALIVEQLTDDVAWVSTDAATSTLTIDMAAADAAVAGELYGRDARYSIYEDRYRPAEDDLGLAVVREGDPLVRVHALHRRGDWPADHRAR